MSTTSSNQSPATMELTRQQVLSRNLSSPMWCERNIKGGVESWARHCQSKHPPFTCIVPCVSKLLWSLCFDMSEPSLPLKPLLNHRETPNSNIVSLTHSTISIFDEGEGVDLTDEELNQPGFIGAQITLCDTDTKISYKNEKGYFTILELVEVIVEFEKVARTKTTWFGGIDTHHIYFEGVTPCSDEGWYTHWGS